MDEDRCRAPAALRVEIRHPTFLVPAVLRVAARIQHRVCLRRHGRQVAICGGPHGRLRLHPPAWRRAALRERLLASALDWWAARIQLWRQGQAPRPTRGSSAMRHAKRGRTRRLRLLRQRRESARAFRCAATRAAPARAAAEGTLTSVTCLSSVGRADKMRGGDDVGLLRRCFRTDNGAIPWAEICGLPASSRFCSGKASPARMT